VLSDVNSSSFLSLFVLVLEYKDRSPVEYNVIGASIMQFNLTNNKILYYNFVVNFTARNSNGETNKYKCRSIIISSIFIVSLLEFLDVNFTFKLYYKMLSLVRLNCMIEASIMLYLIRDRCLYSN